MAFVLNRRCRRRRRILIFFLFKRQQRCLQIFISYLSLSLASSKKKGGERKEKRPENVHTVHWTVPVNRLPAPFDILTRPISPIFIVFHRPTVRHSKRDGYIWEMEIRQGYYVWGLFSQNRVWHGAPAWKCFNGRSHQLRLALRLRLRTSFTSANSSSRSSSFHFRFWNFIPQYWII